MFEEAVLLRIGIGCLVAATILLVVARVRPPKDSRHISASHGGVAIGGNNNGNITTRGADAKPPRNLWQVAGFIIGIAGLGISTLAWLLPQAS
jgi:hypothetical protein